MYFIIIAVISVFMLLEMFNTEIVKKYKYLFAFVCFALLVFQDGFRWETGTDWEPYYNFFQELTINNNAVEDTEFDIGYVTFSYLIRIFTDNYSAFLIAFAILFYSGFFYFIFKISDSPFMSLLIFYMATVYYMGMNRQFLAMIFYALGLFYLIHGSKFKFLVMIVLGALFHKTILIGLAALFLRKKISNIVLLPILTLTIIIAASGVINKLPLGVFALLGENAGTKMEYYSLNGDATSMTSMILATIRRLIWIVPLLILDKKLDKPQGYELIFNLYLIGTLFYMLCNGTILQIVVSRALIYFNIMEMFLVPILFKQLKPNYGKLAITFVLIGYVCLYTLKGFHGYGEGTDYFLPYKGIFINTDYHRQYTR